ncbi:S-formylglutathione hydrolase [Litoribacillus peritrichatus]
MTELTEIGRVRCFDGWQLRYRHHSPVLGCDMVFSVYLPPQAENTHLPHLYWLSGLTCDDQNFVTKAGAQRYAAEHGVIIIAPDTSPRGDGVPDTEAWDFAQGAGFYLNATQQPWSKNYQMESYLLNELIPLINETQPVIIHKRGIFGHSMGGHGALTLALKNHTLFQSVSAFAPICTPIHCPWGQQAFERYLGADQEKWKDYDSCELIKQHGLPWPIRVDQGLDDNFLGEQLMTESLVIACENQSHKLTLKMREGYDHSYFFIASFIGEHIAYHAQQLEG